MIQILEMTVLIDNVAEAPLASEWGLSILIHADNRTILLDTGASGLFAQNAEVLGIDLAKVDTGVLSHALFSIPAVKGVEFGSGFACADKKGSENNDAYFSENGRVFTETNNAGGIIGGISNGMPIVFRCAVKPTPSIAKTQQSVNLQTMQPEDLCITGRHDPCIVPRAVPVIEAAAALAVYDLILGESIWN